jgi:hypothetical protein
MKRTIVVLCVLLGISCLTLRAENASAPRPLWNIAADQLPGDSKNAKFSSVQGHTPGGSGRSLEVSSTGAPGWVGEWCSKPVNWTGFERLAFTVSNSNDFNVSVFARIKTVAGALANVPLDLPPGFSTPVVQLADLKDDSGQALPVDLSQIRQWSINWNNAFEKPIYISNLRVESGAPAPVQVEVPKPAAGVKPAAAVEAVQPVPAPPPAPAAPQVSAPAPPLLGAQTLSGQSINWSAVLCVMMVCVTAIVIAAMLRPKKA